MTTPLEGQVRSERLPGVPGDIADDKFTDKASYINAYPQAKQQDTITASGVPVEGQQYTVTINGVDITSAPLGAAPTLTDAAAAIALAINSEPLVNGRVVASAAVAVVTVDARNIGLGYTLTESEADLALASVSANATADPVPFGRFLVSDAFGQGNNKLARLPDATLITNSAAFTTYGVGCSLRDKTQEIGIVDGETAVYGPNQAMSVGKKVRMYAELEDGPLLTPGDPVFVRVAADGALDQLGGFARAAGTGLVQLLEGKWFRKTDRSHIVVVEVNLP